MRIWIAFLLTLPLCAQRMTVDQKVEDFRSVVDTVAKQYVSLGVKQQKLGVNLLDVRSWMDKVKATKTDLEFQDVVSLYLASFKDTLVFYELPTDYYMLLPIDVKEYDGKATITYIDRDVLPSGAFPFKVGDELVSIDGKPVEQWVQTLMPFVAESEPGFVRRYAVSWLTYRPQNYLPSITASTPDVSKVVIKSGGIESTYMLEWQKYGTPYEAGRMISPKSSGAQSKTLGSVDQRTHVRVARRGLARAASYAIPPAGDLPTGATVRLGNRTTDSYFSATLQRGGKRLGIISIPRMYASTTALNRLASELAYMQANTDGLLIDLVGTNLENGCFAEDASALLIPTMFRSLGWEIRPDRATAFAARSLANTVSQGGFDEITVLSAKMRADAIESAYIEGGVTGSVPDCTFSLNRSPYVDRQGAFIGYAKPIVVLIDNESFAEPLAAILQDNGRATVMGTKTRSTTGDNTGSYFNPAPYGGGYTFMRNTQMTRPDKDGNYTRYFENEGVTPDVPFEIFTRKFFDTNGLSLMEAAFDLLISKIPAPATP